MGKAATKKKKKKNKKAGWIALIVIWSLILAIIIGGYFVFNYYFSMMRRGEDSVEILESIPEEQEESKQEESETIEDSRGDEVTEDGKINWRSYEDDVYQDPDTYNLLLVGTDSREQNMRGRSDAMIIASINKKTNKIILTSLMRDTYVYIPEVGDNRLNAAAAYGGIPLLVRTIEANFNIHIDDYMVTNFFVFAEAVDRMGGVDMWVSAAEAEAMQPCIKEYNNLTGEEGGYLPLEDGSYHLNGKQTLAYCRIRYVGNSDFDRTERQRETLIKLAEKAKGMGIGEINSIALAILPQMMTDMSQSSCLSLLWEAVTDYKNYEIETFRIPADGTLEGAMIDGMSVLSIDFAKNIDLFFAKVYNR